MTSDSLAQENHARPIALPEGPRPPHDEGAESRVIEATIVVPGFFERVFPPLAFTDFYVGSNRSIVEAIEDLKRGGGSIDALSVIEWHSAKGRQGLKPERLRSRPSLSVHDQAQAVTAARIVYELARRRELAALCEKTSAQIYTGAVDSQRALFSDFEGRVSSLCQIATRVGETITAREAIDEATREVMREGGPMGISSGLANYDRGAGLMHRKFYTVIGASTGNGKTAWGLTVAGNVALRGGGVFYAATADMRARELMLRLACGWSGVSARKALDRRLTENEKAFYMRAAGRVATMPIHIDDGHGKTIQELEAQVRRVRSRFERDKIELQLVVIDYVQEVRWLSPPKDWNEEKILRNVSAYAKGIGERNECHVLGLVQTHQPLPTKKNEQPLKPTLESIQNSKAIARPAETVGFIHRLKDDQGKFPARGKAEMVMAKTRWGRKGDVPLIFDGPSTRFEDDPDAVPEED